MNAQSPWPERDDTLRALWAQGLPTLAIAERMGLTKGQVVGRAHRLNLEARPSPIKAPSKPRRLRSAAEPAQHSAAEPPRERPPASHPSILPPGAPLVGGNPKAAVIPLPQPRENGRVYTSFHNIRAWAGVYNIAYDGTNLDRVNTLRIAKSLPPLVQDET